MSRTYLTVLVHAYLGCITPPFLILYNPKHRGTELPPDHQDVEVMHPELFRLVTTVVGEVLIKHAISFLNQNLVLDHLP